MSESESKCPVDHSKMTPEEIKNFDFSKFQAFKDAAPPAPVVEKEESAQTCPVDPSTYKNFVPPKEGCDSDAIDSTNNMPKISQQSPQPDQKMALGTQREISTIPRANSDDKLWVYPSEQMFFNAMRRKNWTPEERDMSVVVPIHNAVNEMAWLKILEWEKMHQT